MKPSCSSACIEAKSIGMIAKGRFALKNAVILIMDPSVGQVPVSMDGGLIAATPSCIAVGTLSDSDGKTSIVLTDEEIVEALDADMHLIHSSRLQTPRREVSVCNVLYNALLTIGVAEEQIKAQIWSNDNLELSKLHIIVRPS